LNYGPVAHENHRCRDLRGADGFDDALNDGQSVALIFQVRENDTGVLRFSILSFDRRMIPRDK
jgi:hypothetical protein